MYELLFVLTLVISLLNKQHVLNSKCFQYFQFISQLFVLIGDHSRNCTCLKFVHILSLSSKKYSDINITLNLSARFAVLTQKFESIDSMIC